MQKKIKILILESLECIRNDFERYFHSFYVSIKPLVYNIVEKRKSIILSIIIPNESFTYTHQNCLFTIKQLEITIEVLLTEYEDKPFIKSFITLKGVNTFHIESRQLYSKHYIKDIKSFLNRFEFSSEIGYNDVLDFICQNSIIITKKQ